jgi:hypothetical protein
MVPLRFGLVECFQHVELFTRHGQPAGREALD